MERGMEIGESAALSWRQPMRTASGLLVAAAALLPAVSAAGQVKSADSLTRISASADVERIVPGGTFRLAVVFRMTPGCHIYWRNPGEAGQAPRIVVRAPDGFRVGETEWPRPRTFVSSGGISAFGYDGTSVLFVGVTAPGVLPAGPVDLEVTVKYLVCEDAACYPGEARRNVRLPAESGGPSVEEQALIRGEKEKLPRPLADLAGAQAEWTNGVLIITGALPEVVEGPRDVVFYPDPTPGAECGPARIETSGGRFVLRVPVTVNRGNALGKPVVLRGLLAFGDGPCFGVDFPVPDSYR